MKILIFWTIWSQNQFEVSIKCKKNKNPSFYFMKGILFTILNINTVFALKSYLNSVQSNFRFSGILVLSIQSWVDKKLEKPCGALIKKSIKCIFKSKAKHYWSVKALFWVFLLYFLNRKIPDFVTILSQLKTFCNKKWNP